VRALAEHPDLPATVMAERLGWTGSITWPRDNVRLLRAGYRCPAPADRLEHAAGDAVQCDVWFPPIKLATGDGRSGVFQVLVMVAVLSWYITAVMVPTRAAPDPADGHVDAARGPARRGCRSGCCWDSEAGIGRGGRQAHGIGKFCGTLATRLVQGRPFDPESRSVVERANSTWKRPSCPGAHLHRPGRLQRSIGQLADPGEQAHGPGTAEPAGGPDRPGTGGAAPAATVPPAIGCRSLIPTQPSRLHRTSTAGMPAHAS
jgi:hypothetical protein